MVQLHFYPRATDFASNVYYVFHNAISPNNSLASGQGQSSKGALSMEVAGTYSSSENWQLYFQQGRYFIRNYDYGGQWQLGLTEDSPVIPKLLKRSGALGQQWTMERQDDGTFKFHNGLLGNSSVLALTKGNKQPAMQTADGGSKWEIIPNPSAQAPKDTSMMLDVSDFEEPPVSSSTISSFTTTSTSTSLPSGTSSSAPSQTTNTGLASNSSPTNEAGSSKSSSSLAPGAIAGVAVGIVLILALVGIISYLVWSRRRPKEQGPPTAELGGTAKSYYAQVGTLQSHAHYAAPAQLDTQAVRYELGDGAVPAVGKTPNTATHRLG